MPFMNLLLLLLFILQYLYFSSFFQAGFCPTTMTTVVCFILFCFFLNGDCQHSSNFVVPVLKGSELFNNMSFSHTQYQKKKKKTQKSKNKPRQIVKEVSAICSARNQIIFTFYLEAGIQDYFSNAVV